MKRYMGLRGLIHDFYERLNKGLAPTILPEDGLLNMRLMDQIKSACSEFVKRRTMTAPSAAATLAPRILVTGASGFLGGHVVARLAVGGPVRAMTRLMSRARPMAEFSGFSATWGTKKSCARH